MIEKIREHVIFWLSILLSSTTFYVALGATGFADLTGVISVLLSLGVLVL